MKGVRRVIGVLVFAVTPCVALDVVRLKDGRLVSGQLSYVAEQTLQIRMVIR